MIKVLSLSFLAMVAVILAGCTPVSAPTEQTETTPQTEPQSTNESTQSDVPLEMSHTKADYNIEMSKFKFSPNVLEAHPGDTLLINLTSIDGTHNFYIDELNVKSDDIKEGEEGLVSITIPEDAAGKSYEFYCAMNNHRQMGMVGKLTVSAN